MAFDAGQLLDIQTYREKVNTLVFKIKLKIKLSGNRKINYLEVKLEVLKSGLDKIKPKVL